MYLWYYVKSEVKCQFIVRDFTEINCSDVTNCYTNGREEINSFLPLAREIHEQVRLSRALNSLNDTNGVYNSYTFNRLQNGRKWNVLSNLRDYQIYKDPLDHSYLGYH